MSILLEKNSALTQTRSSAKVHKIEFPRLSTAIHKSLSIFNIKMKKDNIKNFINEIYSTPLRKTYPTNKIVYNHFDEIWSIDLADFSDYKISNNRRFRYKFIIVDSFSK